MKATGHDWGNLALLLLIGVAVVFFAFAIVGAEWGTAFADVALIAALGVWLNGRRNG